MKGDPGKDNNPSSTSTFSRQTTLRNYRGGGQQPENGTLSEYKIQAEYPKPYTSINASPTV